MESPRLLLTLTFANNAEVVVGATGVLVDNNGDAAKAFVIMVDG